MTLIFDTETTGKAHFDLPVDHPSQPRLVQLAGLLLDANLDERAAFCLLVNPDGYEIPKEASAIHGITTEIAEAAGFQLPGVLEFFSRFMSRARTRVAHNQDFDSLVLGSAFSRIDSTNHLALIRDAFCTMRKMTDHCKLPGKYGFKWPKLEEAYRHCTGADLSGAHDALVDCRACATIYRWLRNSRAASGKCKACGAIISPNVEFCLACTGENEQREDNRHEWGAGP